MKLFCNAIRFCRFKGQTISLFLSEYSTVKVDNFVWLQKWYQVHCDGDWEHDERIRIGTIDNPGWFLTVNLQDTEVEKKEFKEININRTESDWMFCRVREYLFEGRGGLSNLPEILEIFRQWVEKSGG
jgi:hypothetical protein